MEPVLYGPLVQMAEPLVKMGRSEGDAAGRPAADRAPRRQGSRPPPPTGPVFISLPGDILNTEAGHRARPLHPRRYPREAIRRGAAGR